MSNRYLVKIAETLTAQEQAALANGRDRYTVQSMFGGVAGGIAGKSLGAATGLIAPARVAAHAGKLGTIGAVAGGVAGLAKAYQNNSTIAGTQGKDPEAYDKAMISGGKKSYWPAALMNMNPITAGETYYHNDLVEKAQARNLKGYGN